MDLFFGFQGSSSGGWKKDRGGGNPEIVNAIAHSELRLSSLTSLCVSSILGARVCVPSDVQTDRRFSGQSRASANTNTPPPPPSPP